MKKKVVTIVGARPQFIKCAPVSRVLRMRWNEVLVHTGQHYDYGMSDIFFTQLNIPFPDYNLGVGSSLHGMQTGTMLLKIEEILVEEKPSCVIIYGDTNSTLAGALAASKLHIPVVHVEAGLRSYNKAMPEEQNRVMADHLSSLLLCPTENAIKNLTREGFVNVFNNGKLVNSESAAAIFSQDQPLVANVGDVMFDALLASIEIARTSSSILEQYHLQEKQFCVATIHRAENTDNDERLRSILLALSEVSEEYPVVVPLHPRTKKIIENKFSEFTASLQLKFIEPVGYFDMLWLQKNARIILTDSGGMQKEAYFLQTPCITLRDQTEWIETIAAEWNTLCGANAELIMQSYHRYKQKKFSLPQPQFYGDGNAAEKITQILLQNF